jgi:hypothetical protein
MKEHQKDSFENLDVLRFIAASAIIFSKVIF